MNKKLTIIILVIIILAGGFFRLWGIDFGLPNQYHPDEAFFINPVFNVIALQSPDWYGAPGTTVIYANSAIFWLTGNIIDSQASTLQLFQENPYYFLAEVESVTLCTIFSRAVRAGIPASSVRGTDIFFTKLDSPLLSSLLSSS